MTDAAHTYTAADMRSAFAADRSRYPTIRRVDEDGWIYPVVRGLDSADVDRLVTDAMEFSRKDQ